MRRIATGALLFVLGTMLGVAITSLPLRSRIGGMPPGGFLTLVGIGSLTWYACLLSSPLYVWLARRFPIYGRRWWCNLALHFLLTAAIVTLTGVIYFQLVVKPPSNIPAQAERTLAPTAVSPNEKVAASQSRGSAPGRSRGPDLGGFLLFRFFTESLPFWALIALIHA